MRRTSLDFTTGSIPKHLIAFSWPMFVGNVLQALYNVVDSIWVGHYVGANGLAAVSVSFPVLFALIALIMGVSMATTTLVAQYKGAGRSDMVQKVSGNSIMLLVYLGVATTILGLLINVPLLRLINTPSDILPMAAQYLGVFLIGLPLMFIYNVVTSILRGLGDSKTPLRFLFYATVINIVLDPLFIVGFGPIPAMGVGGAALATLIAQAVAAWLGVRYLLRQGLVKLDTWRIDLELARTTFRIGIPAGLQQTLVSVSIVTVSSLINQYGSDVVAGFGAANRIEQFAFLPSMSVGLAVSALVGQNLGAGRDDRVGQIVWWSAALSGGITLIVTLVVLAVPKALLATFTTDSAVLLHGSEYLGILVYAYVPMALMFTIGGVMRGAGDTAANMWITLGTLWFVRVPLAWYLSGPMGMGIHGVWWAMLSSTIAGVILNYLYYRTNRWKRHVVVRQEAPASGEPELSTGQA